jgi:hypothetical protein
LGATISRFAVAVSRFEFVVGTGHKEEGFASEKSSQGSEKAFLGQSKIQGVDQKGRAHEDTQERFAEKGDPWTVNA